MTTDVDNRVTLYRADRMAIALGLRGTDDFPMEPGDLVWLAPWAVDELYHYADIAANIADDTEDAFPIWAVRASCPRCQANRGGTYWLWAAHEPDQDPSDAVCSKCSAVYVGLTPTAFLWDEPEIAAVLGQVAL